IREGDARGVEDVADVARDDAGDVARVRHGARGAARQEVGDARRGRAELAAARAERGALDAALQRDAAERALEAGAFPVPWLERDDETRVGERGVAAREAHAVDDDAVRLGRRGDDPAAGAHAKREDAAALDGV